MTPLPPQIGMTDHCTLCDIPAGSLPHPFAPEEGEASVTVALERIVRDRARRRVEAAERHRIDAVVFGVIGAVGALALGFWAGIAWTVHAAAVYGGCR